MAGLFSSLTSSAGAKDTALAALFASSHAAELPPVKLADAALIAQKRQAAKEATKQASLAGKRKKLQQIGKAPTTTTFRKPYKAARDLGSDDEDEDEDGEKADAAEDEEEADEEADEVADEEAEDSEDDEDKADGTLESRYEAKRSTAEQAHDEEEEDEEQEDMDEDEDESKEKKPAKPKKEGETEEEKQRTIFVGNLPVTFVNRAGKRELIKRFSKHGAVESVRFRSVPVGTLKVPRKIAARTEQLNDKVDTCNAYIKFAHIDSVAKALEENGSLLEGKHIRVDVTSKPAGVQATPDHRRSIFVGNLPFVATDEHLWEAFASSGEIEAVRLVRDAHTNVGKGFAFVTFKDEGSVPLALKLAGTQIEGRGIRITRAKNPKKADQEKKRKQAASGSSSSQQGGSKKPFSSHKGHSGSRPGPGASKSFEGQRASKDNIVYGGKKKNHSSAAGKKAPHRKPFSSKK